MKNPRFSIALALVKDRYILAIGGQTAKSKFTETCDAYDTQLKTWH
jgi:hypothetical protein